MGTPNDLWESSRDFLGRGTGPTTTTTTFSTSSSTTAVFSIDHDEVPSTIQTVTKFLEINSYRVVDCHGGRSFVLGLEQYNKDDKTRLVSSFIIITIVIFCYRGTILFLADLPHHSSQYLVDPLEYPSSRNYTTRIARDTNVRSTALSSSSSSNNNNIVTIFISTVVVVFFFFL